MPAFDFPASPVAGDTVTNADSGITYQWQAAGYWKAIKYDQPVLTPPMFCFRQEGPPPNDLTELMHLVVPSGYRVDLATFEFSLSANPAQDQVYDILVNNVRGLDKITVTTAGAVTIVDDRGPYIGPLEMSIYYELGSSGTIDPAFGTLTVVTEMETV